MNIQVHSNVLIMYAVLVISFVGDGTTICFWTDRCLHGQAIRDLAPTLFNLVPK
jgi:hypothetical protein